MTWIKKITLYKTYFFIVLFTCIISPKIYSKKYVDKENDNINELDTDRRILLQSITLKANHIFDDENQLANEQNKLQAQLVKVDEPDYGEYMAEEGDQLQTISEKIYGTPERWNELAILNETILINNNVTPGMKLRYKISNKIEPFNIKSNIESNQITPKKDPTTSAVTASNFQPETKTNFLETSTGIYTVVKGDQLKKISQKLYGTTRFWDELVKLNKNIIIKNEIKPGMKLKYKIKNDFPMPKPIP